jgi:thiol:disulfide interchange protein DsbD
VNKRTSLEIPRTRKKLEEIGAVALVGDYTREDPAISIELARYHRDGVPLVLVYSKDTNRAPQVLDVFLTPGAVLSALDQAAH